MKSSSISTADPSWIHRVKKVIVDAHNAVSNHVFSILVLAVNGVEVFKSNYASHELKSNVGGCRGQKSTAAG